MASCVALKSNCRLDEGNAAVFLFWSLPYSWCSVVQENGRHSFCGGSGLLRKFNLFFFLLKILFFGITSISFEHKVGPLSVFSRLDLTFFWQSSLYTEVLDCAHTYILRLGSDRSYFCKCYTVWSSWFTLAAQFQGLPFSLGWWRETVLQNFVLWTILQRRLFGVGLYSKKCLTYSNFQHLILLASLPCFHLLFLPLPSAASWEWI